MVGLEFWVRFGHHQPVGRPALTRSRAP
jgi:hypothetical protein